MSESACCPICHGEYRMVWIGNDPPEPYGEVCDCPETQESLRDASEDKRAEEAEYVRCLGSQEP